MAYAALLSVLQTLDGYFPRPLQKITSDLHDNVSCLLRFFEDPSTRNSSSIKHLEGQIRDASFEAQDIIESHVSRQLVLSKSVMCGVGSCFWEAIAALQSMFPASIHLCGTSVDYLHPGLDLELERDLRKVIDEFDSIVEALSKIKDGKEEAAPPQGNSSIATSSRYVASNKSELVGLDEDLMGIKDRLTGSSSKLDIISMFGMGGIGKTTLARNLYNDSLIEYYFQIRAWVVVSQDYDVQQMLTSLVGSTRQAGDELHQKSIEELAVRVYQNLKGRRYLIVMDDVWDTKAWDDIRRFFPDDNNGSRIILTTRQSEVAIYANSNSPHNMSLLNPNASWELLTKTVFGQEECPLGLEKIGREIAQNCKGLPLAIVVIGGLLSKESKEKDWEQIAEDVNSAVARNVGDQFMEILSLSYDSLPHHLRACFLYIAVFPEDHEIIVSQLIKLWIAEGFIKPPTPKSFEEVAEGYLKDLIGRSLIQVRKRTHNGEIKTCIIHDMLRELCVKKTRDEKYLHIIDRHIRTFPQGRDAERRVSVHNDVLNILKNVHDSYVRSLLYFCCSHSTSHIVSCRLLNILDALTVTYHGFPRGIFELVHLRYLAFTYSGERKFPASIYKLQNLQTLIIHQMIVSPHYILHLPSSIWKMPKLRHLLVKRSFLPHPVPTDSAIMENLQTLSEVTNFKCSKEVLMFIPNVTKLGISYYYDSSTDWSSYEFHNFVYLHHLQTLKCLFIATDFLCSRPLPVNLAFPQSLKELTLSGFQFSLENMTVVGSLHNLEVLKLKDCAFEGSVWEPKEGEFTRLSFLLIELTSLEHWRANSTHFPQLRHLRLRYCFMLATIPSEIGDIQALESLELHECTPSAVASAMLIQEE